MHERDEWVWCMFIRVCGGGGGDEDDASGRLTVYASNVIAY